MVASGLRFVIGLVAVSLLAIGVLSVRQATISRHDRLAPDSRLEVVIEAERRGGERGQTLDEYTWAKVLSCRTEVAVADPVEGLEALPGAGSRRFRFVLQPALDHSDRKQFRGCLEDWTVDHLEIGVRSMTELEPLGSAAERDDDGPG